MSTPFGPALSHASGRIEGALAISLIGLDGIAVETIKTQSDVPIESLASICMMEDDKIIFED